MRSALAQEPRSHRRHVPHLKFSREPRSSTTEAIAWFLRSAEQGFARSRRPGVAALLGERVARDYAEAGRDS